MIDRAVTVLFSGNFMQPGKNLLQNTIELWKGYLEIISSLLLVIGVLLPCLTSDAYFPRSFLEWCCMHKVSSICPRQARTIGLFSDNGGSFDNFN